MKEYLLLNFTATFHCLGKDRMDLLSLNVKEQGEKKPQQPKLFSYSLSLCFSSENVNPYTRFVFITPPHSLSSNLLFAFFPEKSLSGHT